MTIQVHIQLKDAPIWVAIWQGTCDFLRLLMRMQMPALILVKMRRPESNLILVGMLGWAWRIPILRGSAVHRGYDFQIDEDAQVKGSMMVSKEKDSVRI